MIRDPQLLKDFLATHPEAWPVRMALIEELVRDGKIEEARLVIRDSPPESKMPGDYQNRIHIALTRGAAGVKSLPPLLGFEERPAAKSNLRQDAPRLSETKTTPPKAGEPPPGKLAISPGSRALAESGALPASSKPAPPILTKAGNTPGSPAAPIMRAAVAGKRPVRRSLIGGNRSSGPAAELSRAAIGFVVAVLLLGTILIKQVPSMKRNPWKTINGDLIATRVVEFDPRTKLVILENDEKVRTSDLDFGSQQRLFFSAAFQKTQLLEGVASWSPEKVKSYTFLFLFAMLLLIGSMWICGFVIARRRNPFVAALNCGVGWLTGSILMVIYSFISERTAAAGVMWIGAAVSLAIVGLLVSALYLISYFKGLLIFVCHAVLFLLVFCFLVFYAEVFFPSSARQFWHQTVFVSTGLVDS